jgi:hypothetical protein
VFSSSLNRANRLLQFSSFYGTIPNKAERGEGVKAQHKEIFGRIAARLSPANWKRLSGIGSSWVGTFKEVLQQSLPLIALLAFVIIFISPMPWSGVIKLASAYLIVMVGQTAFLIGIESSILPMGELTGANLYKLKKPIIMILFGLLFGIISSIAEPALRVVANQFHSIDSTVSVPLSIFICSFGVGAGVALAMWKALKNLSLRWIFVITYGVTMLLCMFTPNQFVGISFDVSGATTGDLSTPFILTLGMGIARTVSSKHRDEDQFGIVGIASVTPLMAYLAFGMIKGNSPPESLNLAATAAASMIEALLGNVKDVFMALTPVVVTFFIFNQFFIKQSKKSLLRLAAFSVWVYGGLVIFLTGVDIGFTEAGGHIGRAFLSDTAIFFGRVEVSGDWFRWMLLPMAFVLCFFITLCEPSISVLVKQVEEMTNGLIVRKTLRLFLAIGIGLAGLLCILNIMLDTDIRWFLIPLYLITVVLTIFAPNLFVGVAYDSGGVTGGAITSAFLVPLTLAVAQDVYGNTPANILVYGFGIIGYISVTPIILVLILGMIYNAKAQKAAATERSELDEF